MMIEQFIVESHDFRPQISIERKYFYDDAYHYHVTIKANNQSKTFSFKSDGVHIQPEDDFVVTDLFCIAMRELGVRIFKLRERML